MSRGRLLVICAAMSLGLGPAGASLRIVVADLPYERVWRAALLTVEPYPLERAGEGVIATGWRVRPAEGGTVGFAEVRERVTLRVERFGEGVTRVTIEVAAHGWRDGREIGLAEDEVLLVAREVSARLRALLG